MTHRLKAPPRTAGTEVIAAEHFVQLLVAVNDAVASAHGRLGGITPSSAYWSPRKQRRSSSWRMAHLPGGGLVARLRVRAQQLRATTNRPAERSCPGSPGPRPRAP